MAITRADIDAICASLPGATEAHPPELISWKVGGKMFACMGLQDGREGVSAKCPDVETAQMLIEAGIGHKAKYFHKSWIRLHADESTLEEARHRLLVSYDTVRASLTKKAQAALPQREAT